MCCSVLQYVAVCCSERYTEVSKEFAQTTWSTNTVSSLSLSDAHIDTHTNTNPVIDIDTDTDADNELKKIFFAEAMREV